MRRLLIVLTAVLGCAAGAVATPRSASAGIRKTTPSFMSSPGIHKSTPSSVSSPGIHKV